MYAVLTTNTQEQLAIGPNKQPLIEEFEEKGYRYWLDFYIAELTVLIDRPTQQIMDYALDSADLIRKYNYVLDSLDYYVGKLSNFNRFSIIFHHPATQEYIAFKEGSLTDAKYWNLLDTGFEVFSDICSMPVYEYLMLHDENLKKVRYEIRQITLKDAQSFVNIHHRHHLQPQGHRFSLGAFVAGTLIGVIIAGRPVARHNDDGYTLEVTRCCVLEGFPNAISMLYGRVQQTAKLWGYRQIITYTLEEESGTSLKASGFMNKGAVAGGSWHSRHRPRIDKHPTTPKTKWVKSIFPSTSNT